MISAIGSRSRGFSLLEILIVLTIIVLFSGLFALRFDDSRGEELLSRASVGIKSASLKAKRRSFAFRRDQYIVFTANGFRITERGGEGEEPLGGFDSDREQASTFKPFAVPPGVKMEILPTGATKWTKPNRFVWSFRDSGLSDPLSVRFSVGKSYTKLTFNVLTGLPEEETFIQ